jgi:hypothetical protein
MPQRDYLLRLVEQAIEAILQSAKLRKAGQHAQALHSVVASMETLFGLTIADLGTQSVDQIFDQLTRDESPRDARNKCLVFAALNREAGLTYESKELVALAQPAFYLSLVFTLRALTRFSRDDLPPFTPKIDDLLSRLDGFELPPEVRDQIETLERSAS